MEVRLILFVIIVILVFGLTLWGGKDVKRATLYAAIVAVLEIMASIVWPGWPSEVPVSNGNPSQSESGEVGEEVTDIEEETKSEEGKKEENKELNSESEEHDPDKPVNSDEAEEDESEIEDESEGKPKEDIGESPISIEQKPPQKPIIEETTQIQPVYEERIKTKQSYLEYEEGWECIDRKIEWGEWKITEAPRSFQNTDTYEVKEVRGEVTKKQYRYYNWWYYKDNVKMFSSDNNEGTIPQEQYWEDWFDYTMESIGYVRKFDSGDGVEFWWNKSNNDCRYFGGEREVTVVPALYEEREGRYLYTHQKIELVQVN